MAEIRVESTRSDSVLSVFTRPRMLALLLLGFSSGLPLYLFTRTVQAWLTDEGVDLTTIGLFSLVSLPVSLKFLWAPVLDRYVPPILGRRRGWLLVTQVLLLLAIAAMAFHDPETGLRMLAINTFLIAFLSASQDIVGDAYRTDLLAEREMAAGSAVWVLGYRIAMLVTGSVAFILADHVGWPTAYIVMSLLMLVGIVTDFWAPEPSGEQKAPASLAEAVWHPFRDFFERAGIGTGALILAFIVLYKLPDYLAIGMSTPFLLQIGFSETAIGAVNGGVGLFATILGSLAGGALASRMSLNRSLWITLVVQSLSQVGYLGLSLHRGSYAFMVGAVVLENFVYGIATTVMLAYLMALCSKRFSATQFALLSSLMAVSRDLLVAPAGAVAEATGWPGFFAVALLSGIPALLLLPVLAPWGREHPVAAAAHTGEVAACGGAPRSPPRSSSRPAAPPRAPLRRRARRRSGPSPARSRRSPPVPGRSRSTSSTRPRGRRSPCATATSSSATSAPAAPA
jgi:PAT family beta-lactamase induction signal transducer AmpG